MGGKVITPEEQWNSLNEYIKSIPYLNENRGEYVERNGARTPWNHSLDMSFKFNLAKVFGNSASFRLDIFNVLNVINSSWGKQYFVPNTVNSSFSLLKVVGITDDVPSFSFDIPLDSRPWIVDTFNSRWRMQLGFEYLF